MDSESRCRCCYMYTGNPLSQCVLDAEFEIRTMGPGVDYYDITHACAKHVGELLGSINDAEATHWIVLPKIGGEYPLECRGPQKGCCFFSSIELNCNLGECGRAAYEAEREIRLGDALPPWKKLGMEQDYYNHMALAVVRTLRYFAGGDRVCRVKTHRATIERPGSDE